MGLQDFGSQAKLRRSVLPLCTLHTAFHVAAAVSGNALNGLLEWAECGRGIHTPLLLGSLLLMKGTCEDPEFRQMKYLINNNTAYLRRSRIPSNEI